MQDSKYYSHRHSRPLDLEHDGCSWEQWQHGSQALFARHPQGFAVFLDSHEIAGSDEYAEADPYTVEENIGNDFHQRRMDVTLGLLHQADTRRGAGAPSLRVLDLGCGQGHLTHKMRSAMPGAEFSALDYSVSAIEYAHAHYPGIDFVVSNAYEPPYRDAYFDVVVCNNLWEHVPDPLHLLGRISRTLKPNGSVIISTPSRYRLDNIIRFLRGKPIALMSHHHVTEYSVGQVVEQLRFGGFSVVAIDSRPDTGNSLKQRLLRKLIGAFIARTRSRHQLESTIFFLAQKQQAVSG